MVGRSKTDETVEKERARFLIALSETGSVLRSCELAQVARPTVYRWRESDKEFGKAWDAALERGTDALEDEAVRRAYHGTEKPVYQGGKKVGHVREYSDTLLIFMLKARRPERFKDRSEHKVDVTSHSRPLSDTAELLAATLGDGAQGAPKKPLPH